MGISGGTILATGGWEDGKYSLGRLVRLGFRSEDGELAERCQDADIGWWVRRRCRSND